MLNERHDDDALFRGFDTLVPTEAASQRAVEQTRQLLLERAHAREPIATGNAKPAMGMTAPAGKTSPLMNVRKSFRLRSLAWYGLAASLALVAGLGVYFLVARDQVDTPVITSPSTPAQHPQGAAPRPKVTFLPAGRQGGVGLEDLIKGDRGRQALDMAGWAIPKLHALVAESAPVIVANGGKKPLHLGSATREHGGLLHVWSWSKGAMSCVLPKVEFWGNDHVAISPDGKWLVWARGDILDLQTGKSTRIDLGGADFKIGEHTYTRIGAMRFSPDGGRLALGVTNFDETRPGLIKSEVVQIVEFPTGRRLAKLFEPVARVDPKRLALLIADLDSAKFAVRKKAAQELEKLGEAAIGACRKALDGEPSAEVRRRLKSLLEKQARKRRAQLLCEFPPGESYVLPIGFSKDGKQIASGDRERQILRRDTATGKVLQRYAPALKSQVMGVAISPDGKYVAATQHEPGDLFIWEADSGRLLRRLDGGGLRKLGGHYPGYGPIRFSPDGKYLAAAYWGRLFVFDMKTGKTAAALREVAATNIQWSADGKKVTVVSPVTLGSGNMRDRKDRYPAVHEWDWRNNKRIDLTPKPPTK
jgi:WD40 repeat protein